MSWVPHATAAGSRPFRWLPLPVEPRDHAATADRDPRESAHGAIRRSGRHFDQTEHLAHVDAADVVLRHAGFANQGADEVLRAGPILLPHADEDFHASVRAGGGGYRIPHPGSRIPL